MTDIKKKPQLILWGTSNLKYLILFKQLKLGFYKRKKMNLNANIPPLKSKKSAQCIIILNQRLIKSLHSLKRCLKHFNLPFVIGRNNGEGFRSNFPCLSLSEPNAVWRKAVLNAYKFDAQSWEDCLQKLSWAQFKIFNLNEVKKLANLLAGCGPNPAMLNMGLSEMMLNAIEHGNLGLSHQEKCLSSNPIEWFKMIQKKLKNPFYRKTYVLVKFERRKRQLVFTIRDQGKGFNYLEKRTLSSQILPSKHGKGILMARTLAFDRIEYLGCGNTVRCIKNI